MHRKFFLLLLCFFTLSVFAAEEELWKGNKLTTEQPFPARVRAVFATWAGYDLLLEEIGGEERLCFAQVYASLPLTYRIVADAKAEVALEPQRKKEYWTYLSPAMDVDKLNWACGLYRLGRVFGEDDVLRKAVRATPAK